MKDWQQVVKKLQVGEIMAVVEGPLVQEALVRGVLGLRFSSFRDSVLELQGFWVLMFCFFRASLLEFW